jgi:hypothetical protein
MYTVLRNLQTPAEPGCYLGQCVTCVIPAEDCAALAEVTYVEMRGDAGNDPEVYSLG